MRAMSEGSIIRSPPSAFSVFRRQRGREGEAERGREGARGKRARGSEGARERGREGGRDSTDVHTHMLACTHT